MSKQPQEQLEAQPIEDAEMQKHKTDLQRAYGHDVYRIMPKGYRDRATHMEPFKEFLFTLCALARLGEEDQWSLPGLRACLIGACNERMVSPKSASTDSIILLSDVKKSLELSESLMEESSGEEDEGASYHESSDEEGEGASYHSDSSG